MGLKADDYRNQMIALQPRGMALPTHEESDWVKLLAALAEEKARADGRVEQLLKEMDPRTTFEMLEDWERVLDLPDPCRIGDPGGLGERRDAAAAKMIQTGSQTPAYFVAIANRLGYDITIEEIPLSMSGGLVAGGELSGTEEDRFWWRVNVPVQLSGNFIAGNSVAGDELGSYRPNELECRFGRLKPAHTQIEYQYIAEV